MQSRSRRKRRRAGYRSEPPQGRTSRGLSSLGEFLDQKGVDLGGIDVGRDEAFADSARQDERQLASLDLFVLGNEFHQTVGAGQTTGNRGEMDRQTHRRKVTLHALGLRSRKQPPFGGEGER